jgi:lipopolysaccharide/colanic/teichoic acid biosynthesis glycosyltransferase
VDPPKLVRGELPIKGIFDKSSVALGLIRLVPIFVVIALSIRITNREPVFFKKTWVVRNDYTFLIWNLRTVMTNAISDMSLGGPGLALTNETAKYWIHMRRKPVIAPGITSLWQPDARSDLSRDDKVKLDLRSVENWRLAPAPQTSWRHGERRRVDPVPIRRRMVSFTAA